METSEGIFSGHPLAIIKSDELSVLFSSPVFALKLKPASMYDSGFISAYDVIFEITRGPGTFLKISGFDDGALKPRGFSGFPEENPLG